MEIKNENKINSYLKDFEEISEEISRLQVNLKIENQKLSSSFVEQQEKQQEQEEEDDNDNDDDKEEEETQQQNEQKEIQKEQQETQLEEEEQEEKEPKEEENNIKLSKSKLKKLKLKKKKEQKEQKEKEIQEIEVKVEEKKKLQPQYKNNPQFIQHQKLRQKGESVLPRLGITLHQLYLFIESCGGSDKIKRFTTLEVRNQFIRPLTVKKKVSYCEMLKSLNNNHEGVGMANVYISHIWTYNFLDVVKHLFTHFNYINPTLNSEETNNIIIWFDIFSINQHKNQIHQLPENTWFESFTSLMRSIRKTILIIDCWNELKPLRRTWCLWELYCTAVTETKFEIIMKSDVYERMIENLTNDADDEVQRLVSIIEFSDSRSTLQTDKEIIRKNIIPNRDVMFFQSRICDLIKGRMIFYLEKELQSNTKLINIPDTPNNIIDNIENITTNKTLRGLYLHSLGTLLRYHDELPKSELIYEECYHLRKEVLGLRDANFLRTVSTLANVKLKLEKFQESKELYEEALPLFSIKFGPQHPNTVMAMCSLGSLYVTIGELQKADKILKECEVLTPQVFGEVNQFYAETINCLGKLYYKKGLVKKSRKMFDKYLKLIKNTFGTLHPQTEEAHYEVSMFYFHQKNYQKAEELMEKALSINTALFGEVSPTGLKMTLKFAEILKFNKKFQESEEQYFKILIFHRQVYGPEHPETIGVFHDFSDLYVHQNEFLQAKQLLEDIYKLRERILGPNHIDTLTTLNKLNEVTHMLENNP